MNSISTDIFDIINNPRSNKDDDFDLGIDFDTAYNMITKEFVFDTEESTFGNNSNNNNNNLYENIPSPMQNYVASVDEQINNHPSIDSTLETPHAEVLNSHINAILNHENTNIQLPPPHVNHPGLLTTNESSAIENFLESLMTSNPSPPQIFPHSSHELEFSTTRENEPQSTSTGPTALSTLNTPILTHDNYDNVDIVLSPIIPRPNDIPFIVPPNNHIGKEIKYHKITSISNSEVNLNSDDAENDNIPIVTHVEEVITSESTYFDDLLHNNEINFSIIDIQKSDYMPKALYFPELKIPDSEVPTHLKQDIKQIKKWKHVEAEKQRRNLIKKAFDNLISIIKTPKDQEEFQNVSKPHISKRIPKHIQLGQIVQDIKLLKKANEKLELMIKHDFVENNYI